MLLSRNGRQPSRAGLPEQNPSGHPGGTGQGEAAADAGPVHEQPRSQHPALGPEQPEGGEGQRGAAAHRRPAEGRPAARSRPLLRLLHHPGLLVREPHPPGASPTGARPLTEQYG